MHTLRVQVRKYAATIACQPQLPNFEHICLLGLHSRLRKRFTFSYLSDFLDKNVCKYLSEDLHSTLTDNTDTILGYEGMSNLVGK